MFLISRPSEQRIEDFLAEQHSSPFSYTGIGTSATSTAERGMVVDHNRVLLGHGEETYRKAVAAVSSWKMFDLDWLKLYWPGAPIKVGTEIAIVIKHMGFWSLNANRV